VTPKAGSSVFARWRRPIFAFLYRNAVKVVDRFSLPAGRVLEIARQIEI
jgi:KUP system potassium uptake protein